MRFGVCFVCGRGRIATAGAGYHCHIALLQGSSRSIVRLRLCCGRGHIAAHVCPQEDRCPLGRPVGHIYIKILIGGILHICHIEQPFVGCEVDLRAVIEGHFRFHTCIGIKCQCTLCHCFHGEADTQHYCKNSLHFSGGVFRVDTLVSAKTFFI